MKRNLTIFIIIIFVGGLFNAFVNPANAATPRDASYKFDVLAEHTRLWLTFNREARIKLAWKYADEKLGEIEFEKDNIWEATRAELYYKKYITIVLTEIGDGTNLSPEILQTNQKEFIEQGNRIVSLYDSSPVYTKFIPVDISNLFFQDIGLAEDDSNEIHERLVNLPKTYEEEFGDTTFTYEDVGPVYTSEPDPIIDDIFLDEEDIPEAPVEPPVEVEEEDNRGGGGGGGGVEENDDTNNTEDEDDTEDEVVEEEDEWCV